MQNKNNNQAETIWLVVVLTRLMNQNTFKNILNAELQYNKEVKEPPSVHNHNVLKNEQKSTNRYLKINLTFFTHEI